jgi:diadenosine tetraphosphate (Ap4A) HIT family hydrolase
MAAAEASLCFFAVLQRLFTCKTMMPMSTCDAIPWDRLVRGIECPLCDLSRKQIVGELPSGYVEFVADADFIGYCILVHRRHVVELFELSAEEQCEFITDVTHVAKCLADLLKPDKINYEILGNAVPHLHCHIFPRYLSDGYWGGPIWWRPIEKRRWLSEPEAASLAGRIRSALAAGPVNP